MVTIKALICENNFGKTNIVYWTYIVPWSMPKYEDDQCGILNVQTQTRCLQPIFSDIEDGKLLGLPGYHTIICTCMLTDPSTSSGRTPLSQDVTTVFNFRKKTSTRTTTNEWKRQIVLFFKWQLLVGEGDYVDPWVNSHRLEISKLEMCSFAKINHDPPLILNVLRKDPFAGSSIASFLTRKCKKST